MPGLPPGGIMPIMGAPGIGRPPGGIPGMPGCPPGLLAMFIVPNMNCCGGTPAPALAITFFSSPSLPPPFARGCGTPCPLCGGGVDMTHFPLFSIHATLLRVRSLSLSEKSVSFVSHPVPRFHDLRSVPPPARDSTRLARSHAFRARDPLLVRPRTHRRSPFANAIFPLTISHPSHASPPPTLRTAARLRRTIALLVALALRSRVASSRVPVVVAIDPSRTTRRRSCPSRGFGPPLSTSRCVLAERARGSRTSGFGVALAIAARAVVLRTRGRAVARSS